MATITIALRKDQPDSNGYCRIIILYRHGTKAALKHSIGEKVLPQHFDESKQLVIKNTRAKEINFIIEQQKQLINNIVFDIKREGNIPTASLVKSLISSYRQKRKSEQLIEFQSDGNSKRSQKWIDSHEEYGWMQKDLTPAQAWEQFISLRKNVVTKETVGIYRTTLDQLKNYCKNHNRKLDWDLFDMDFYNYWNNYFIEECENQFGDIGLSNNTIGKYFKTLKTFLYWAFEKQYHKNLKFKKYKVLQETIDIHPISEAHLAKIIWYCDERRNDLMLRKTGSLFVFLCTTGLRFSDGQNLRWSDIFYTGEGKIEQQVLRITTQKTGQKLMIPFSPYSIGELYRNAMDFEQGKLSISEILKQEYSYFDGGDLRKYFKNEEEFSAPLLPQISLQKFNKYIKELGKACEFNEPIVVNRKIGNKPIVKTFRRWEKLSSHDCRRTFITLSLSKGMRPETVMSITGHKSYKTMLRYNKLTDKSKIEEFQITWGEPKGHHDELWKQFELTDDDIKHLNKKPKHK
jgi:integrase